MLAKTSGTYQKLSKTVTTTPARCRELFRSAMEYSAMPLQDIVKVIRGRNDIFYWRPAGGRFLNEKVAMIYHAPDGSATLYL